MITSNLFIGCVLGSATIASGFVLSPNHFNTTFNGTAINSTGHARGRTTRTLSAKWTLSSVYTSILVLPSTESLVSEKIEIQLNASSRAEISAINSSSWIPNVAKPRSSTVPEFVTSSESYHTAAPSSSFEVTVNTTGTPHNAQSSTRYAVTTIGPRSSSSIVRPAKSLYYSNTTSGYLSEVSTSKTSPSGSFYIASNSRPSPIVTQPPRWSPMSNLSQSYDLTSSSLGSPRSSLLGSLQGSNRTLPSLETLANPSNVSSLLGINPSSPLQSESTSTFAPGSILNSSQTVDPTLGMNLSQVPAINSSVSISTTQTSTVPLGSGTPFRFANFTPNWNDSNYLIPSNARFGASNITKANLIGTLTLIGTRAWATGVKVGEQHVPQTILVRPGEPAFSAEQHVTQTNLERPKGPGNDARITPRPDRIGALNVGWFPKPTITQKPQFQGQNTELGELSAEEHLPRPGLFLGPVRETGEAATSATGRGRMILEWDHDPQTGLGAPTQPTNAALSPVNANAIPTTTQKADFGSIEPFGVDGNGIGIWQGPPPTIGQLAPNAGPTAGLGANINTILPEQQGVPQVSGISRSQTSVLPVASNPEQGVGQGTGQGNGQGSGQVNDQGTGQTSTAGTGTNNVQGNGQTNAQGTGSNNVQGTVAANGQGTGQTNTQGTGTNNAQGAGPGNSQGTGQTNTQGTETNNAPGAVASNGQGAGQTNNPGTGTNNVQGNGQVNTQGTGANNVQGTGQTNTQGTGANNAPGNGQSNGQANGAAQPTPGSGLGANLAIGARPQSQESPQIPGAQTPQSSVLHGTSNPIPGLIEPQGPEPVQFEGQPGASVQGAVPQGTVSTEHPKQTVANSGLIVGNDGIGQIGPGQTTPQRQPGLEPNDQQPGPSSQGQIGTQATGTPGIAGQSGNTVPVQGQNAGSTEGGVTGASSTENPQQNGNTNPVQGGSQGDNASGSTGQTGGSNPVQGGGGSNTNPSLNGQPGVPSPTQNGGQGGGSLPNVEPSKIPNQAQNGAQGGATVPIANPNQVQSGAGGTVPSQNSQPAVGSNQASNDSPNGATSSQTNGQSGGASNGQNGLEGSGLTQPASPEQVPAFGNGGVGGVSNTKQGGTPASAGANLPVAIPTTVSNSGLGLSRVANIGAGYDGIGQIGTQVTPAPNSGSSPTGNSVNSGGAANGQGVAVDGNTIVQDSSPVTISGNAVAISSGIIHVGSNRAPIPVAGPNQPTPSPVVVGGLTFSPLPKPAAALPTPPVVVAGQTIENNNGIVQVGGQTLQQGASPIDVGGTPVSLGESNLVVGTSVLPRPDMGTPVSIPVVGNVGDTPVQAVNGGVQIGSTTLTPGAAATISGVPVALGNNDDLVIGDKTTTFSRASPVFDSPLAQLGNLPVEPVESGIRIGSSTLVPGAAATIDNTPVSLGNNNNLIIGSSTISFTPSPAASPNSPTPIATIASQPIVPLPSNSGIQIGTSVLTPGAAATIAGTPVIVGSSNDLVIGSNTITYTPPSAASPAAAVVTLGSTRITANSASEFVIDGQTLAPGNSPLIIASTTYSLALSASAIVINGITSPLLTPPSTTAAANQILTLDDNNGNEETATRIPNGNVIIADQTLSPFGPAATISGTPISIDFSGGVIIGSSTYTFPSPTQHLLSDGGPAATFSGVAVSMDDGGLIVGSSTVDLSSAQGAMITVGGTVLSAGPSGLVIWGPKTTDGWSSRVRPTTTVVVGGKATDLVGVGVKVGGRGVWGKVVVAVVAVVVVI